MCDLRCRGQMYVNQNSVFPQWWDRFVKRLMCPNPVKDFGWVQAAAPTTWGRKARVFLTGGSLYWWWFSCVKHVCSKCLEVMDLLTGSSMLPMPNEWVFLSHNQDFGAYSQDIPAAISNLNINRSLSMCKQDKTLSYSRIDGKSCCCICPNNVSKWRSPLNTHLPTLHHCLHPIHFTFYWWQICRMLQWDPVVWVGWGTPRDFSKIVLPNCNLRIKNIWK